MQIYADLPQHLENGDANPEWLILRAGKFTGSDFNQYMSIVNKGELSDTAESNLYKKVLESMGYLFDSVRSSAMEQGNELEPYARKEYIEETFNDVQEVAFVDWGQMRAGCSPDGVIYDGDTIVKILEIKSPEIKNYIKMAKGKIPKLYECQMQFNMLITGAESCDFVVYHPDMKLSIQTILPDEKWQTDIKDALEKLNAKYNDILKEIKELKK